MTTRYWLFAVLMYLVQQIEYHVQSLYTNSIARSLFVLAALQACHQERFETVHEHRLLRNVFHGHLGNHLFRRC